MINLRFTIPGAPRTKKNSLQATYTGGKLRIVPSKAFIAYQDASGWYIPCKYTLISEPVNLRAVYYMPTRGQVDLGNLLAATCDILTHYGVIADDNAGIVAGHDGSRVRYDKENPRAEIFITSMEEKDR